MIKIACCLSIAILLPACGGELTKEQKSRIRESMEDGQIRRVSPADLTVAAYALGRKVTGKFAEDRYLQDSALVQSVASAFGVSVFTLKEGVKTSERALQVLEAYRQTEDASDLEDNVQKLGKDTILYTLPVSFDRPDGSRVFSHAIAVSMPVKSIIRSMPE